MYKQPRNLQFFVTNAAYNAEIYCIHLLKDPSFQINLGHSHLRPLLLNKMHPSIFAFVVVLAVTAHTVSAAPPSPTCLGVASAATAAWSNSTKTLDYVPAPFRSNCGYLTLLASTSCNANCTNPRACCGAACGWNGAGCGCLTGKFPAFMKSIPIDGAEPLTPGQLSKSTCKIGPVYSGPTCKNVPAGGASHCNKAKPPTEDATCSSKYKTSR